MENSLGNRMTDQERYLMQLFYRIDSLSKGLKMTLEEMYKVAERVQTNPKGQSQEFLDKYNSEAVEIFSKLGDFPVKRINK